MNEQLSTQALRIIQNLKDSGITSKTIIELNEKIALAIQVSILRDGCIMLACAFAVYFLVYLRATQAKYL